MCNGDGSTCKGPWRPGQKPEQPNVSGKLHRFIYSQVPGGKHDPAKSIYKAFVKKKSYQNSFSFRLIHFSSQSKGKVLFCILEYYYEEIGVLPKGARDIRIEEVTASQNNLCKYTISKQ